MNVSFRQLVADCRKLIAAAEAHEAEVPSLGCFKAALEEALEDATVAKTRQINLTARRCEVTAELNDHCSSVREAMSRLKSYVRASFGWNDERLADFDIPVHRPLGKEPEKENGSPGYH